jgi:hypothetical protein
MKMEAHCNLCFMLCTHKVEDLCNWIYVVILMLSQWLLYFVLWCYLLIQGMAQNTGVLSLVKGRALQSTTKHGLSFSGQGLYQKDPIHKKIFTGCIVSPHWLRSKSKMTWRSIIKLKNIHHVSMAYMFNTITTPSQTYYTLIILPKLGPCHQFCGPPTIFSLT